MSKIFQLICFVLIISTSIIAQKKIAVVSGKIINNKETTMRVSHIELNFEQKIAIDNEGNFRDTIHLKEEASYYFSIGRLATQFFLKDGYDLHLTLDANDFHKSIKYSGIGGDINNFNLQLSQLRTKLVGDAKEFFVVPLNDFLNKNFNNKKEYLTFVQNSNLSDKDKIFFNKVIETDYLLIHNNYDKFYFYHTKTHPDLTEDYYDSIINLQLDDEDLFLNDKNFRILVIENYRRGLAKASKADSTFNKIQFVKESTKDIKSVYVREAIISMLFNNVNNKNLNYYADYEEIMALLVSNEMKDKLNERLKTARGTTSGTHSTGFEYESFEGKKVSLSDFKGKLVYIDIWATWCGPCIKQMPALKEIIKEYEGKNIAFVVISVDDKKDYAKWKKMVPVYNVGGTHLISDNALNSEFMKSYGVGLIPRSILIDTEGNIINNFAPKPSDENLRAVLDQLLSKVQPVK
ncbi:MAG TPA: TlpA disulfide reductase family protein [Saprospiraceae bacterium]|nr:TlpA disulfide reductase family protein [Saprospiraceae bacterium]